MMYLSKVFLHPGNLDNGYEWHRSLWTLFPGFEMGSASPFLYRIESMNLARGAQVLMTSTEKPVEQSRHAKVLASKQYGPKLYQGQLLRFLLQTNPTRKIRDKDNPERKIRVPLIKLEEQRAWLERKLESYIKTSARDLHIRNLPPVYFHRGRRHGKIVPVIFEGIIEILDPDKMWSVIQQGIGPAKAFGCGLILVRRI